jgi:hypothetical protein
MSGTDVRSTVDGRLKMDGRNEANLARYRPGRPGGHYESYFVRANHPAQPEAFWIRYTIFQPKGRPQDAVGEVWAIHFDGVRHSHTVAQVERPIAECEFGTSAFLVRVADSELGPGRLRGAAGSGAGAIAWDLVWDGDAPAAYVLPKRLHSSRLLPTKSITPWPQAQFRGTLTVGGRRIGVAEWPGSENHNWGSRHIDRNAWGQVVGFDGAPDSWLEAATGKVRFGPLWSPWVTLLVLRHEGREYLLNSAWRALRSTGTWGPYAWTVAGRNADVRLQAEFTATAEDFVVLRYRNPPGDELECRNSTIARCRLTLVPAGKPPVVLTTSHGAAFELLGRRPG